jgi:hypothetical protein
LYLDFVNQIRLVNKECIGLNISAVSAKDAQYQSDFSITFLYKNNVSVNLEHKQLIARGIQNVLSFFPKRIDDTNTYTHIDKSDLINKIKVQDKMIYENDKQIFENSDLGEFVMFEGQMVPLDLPMENIEALNEAEYHGKEVKLNHPMSSYGMSRCCSWSRR